MNPQKNGSPSSKTNHNLQIGQSCFTSPIVQAPLAGISCAPFRLLAWEYGDLAYCCTEMLSAKSLIQYKKLARRYYYKAPGEGPLCFQLAGNDAKELYHATRLAEDFGADLIDLNCGCPKPKITKKGIGAKLLEDPLHLHRLVVTLKQATTLPVTVKIRLSENTDAVIAAVTDAGADALIIHGRTALEDYDTPADLPALTKIVSNASLPIIGNGDVACQNSFLQLMATGCQGAMIARSSVGQPWLSKNILAGTPQAGYAQGELFYRHIEGLASLDNVTVALLQARKLVKYYFRTGNIASELQAKVNACEDLATFREVLKQVDCQ